MIELGVHDSARLCWIKMERHWFHKASLMSHSHTIPHSYCRNCRTPPHLNQGGEASRKRQRREFPFKSELLKTMASRGSRGCSPSTMKVTLWQCQEITLSVHSEEFGSMQEISGLGLQSRMMMRSSRVLQIFVGGPMGEIVHIMLQAFFANYKIVSIGSS